MQTNELINVNLSKNDSDMGLFRNLIDDLDLDPSEREKLTKFYEQNSEKLNELFSHQLYHRLDSEKNELLFEHYRLLEDFRNRLFETWETPLKRLDSLIYICMEIVSELRGDQSNPLRTKTNKFNVATRLHARCVQVANEISHLLHGGYADGAFARWRTLHETSATTKFICEGDEDLSSRFLDFQNIIRLSAATKYNDKNMLGFQTVPADELEKMKKGKDETLARYGPQFERKFGWARVALGNAASAKGDLTFPQIETFVGLDFLRNHFSFANQYVHAGIDSIGFKLGTSMSNKDILLTGPSNEGLVEPIQCTSLSLFYATEAVLKAYPSEHSMVETSVLWLWHDVLKQEVFDASNALQAKGDAIRAYESDI